MIQKRLLFIIPIIILLSALGFYFIGGEKFLTRLKSFTKGKVEGISVPVKGSAYRVTKSGNVAAVLTRDRDIEVVDVTNPKSAQKIKTLETPGFGETVFIDDNYIYVGDTSEFQIYKDIQKDPVGRFNLAEYKLLPEAMTVKDGLAYIVSSQFMILDVSDPANIKKLSVIKNLKGDAVNKIIVKDGFAYVVQTLGGINIIDVKNPKRPKIVKVVPLQSHYVGFDIKGNYAYLTRVVKISGGKASEQGIEYDTESALDVYNISDPRNPKLVSSTGAQELYINLAIEGNLLYVDGEWPAQMTIFDISNPERPVETKKISDLIRGSTGFQDMVVGDGFAYFADGISGLQIAEIGNLSNPNYYTGKVEFGGRGTRIYKHNNLVFLTVEKKYINFVDVSDPGQPKLGKSILYQSSYIASNFDSTENYVFANAEGLKIYDAANPADPVQTQKTRVDADSIQIEGKYLYSVIGEVGILVYDISDITSPKIVTTAPLPAQGRDLSVDGQWGVVTANIPYSVVAIDLSDPKKPAVKGMRKYDEYQDTATVHGNLVVVPRLSGGPVDILKIEPDGSLSLQNTIKRNGHPSYHAAITGEQLYLARNGIEIFNIADPKKPKFIKNISTNGEPARIVTDGSYLYIADGLAGLSVVKIDD